MVSSVSDTSSSRASSVSYPPSKRASPINPALSTSSASGRSSRCSSMELGDSTDYELIESPSAPARPTSFRHSPPQAMPQPTHLRFRYAPSDAGTDSDNSSVQGATSAALLSSTNSTQVPDAGSCAGSSRSASPKTDCSARARPAAPALVAAPAAAPTRTRSRDMLLFGIALALATGAAVSHTRWLGPTLALSASVYDGLQGTLGHLSDGVQGFVYAYNNGVPRAIYDAQGTLLPCQSVVQVQLLAPAQAIYHR